MTFYTLRRAARIDKNQPEIVDALREAGASVCHLHTIGKGCPDLLVGLNGKNYLMEVKDAAKGRLTADQERFFEQWQGQVMVITSSEEAMQCLLA